MMRICGRILLIVLIIVGSLPALTCWSQKAGQKRETIWNPSRWVSAIIRRAQQEYDKKSHERALKLYREALETLPEGYLHGSGKANIHFDIGTCYTQLRRYKEAISAIEKSNSLLPDPDYLATHCALLGMVYSRMEDYARAEQYWQKATERDPRKSVYFAGLANNSVRLGYFDKTQEVIDNGLQVAGTGEESDDEGPDHGASGQRQLRGSPSPVGQR